MGRRKSPAWVWQQVWWPQPLDPDLALELLERVVADRHNHRRSRLLASKEPMVTEKVLIGGRHG